MNEDISVTFIIPEHCRSENDCSEEMQLAFVTCEQHCGGGLQARWVHESKWTKFDGLTKRDVFVLTEFEGTLYEKLQATKCLLVGPRCLSCCLTEGTPIPSGPEPVFTIAMRGLVVTASGLSKSQKEEIKKKVHWMGGIYSTVLTDDTTHLVSDTVLSDKYIKSVEKGIPIMAITWIEAVWETSLRLNVSGSSPDFLVHRLPPFTNLQVTTSGIAKKEKQLIMKLVNEHGGMFSGAFQSETTDVVVLTKEGIGSEKYKAALEYGKAAVLPAWVTQSAAAGVALPLARYRVAGASTSSPLAESRLPDMSLNFSRITNLRPPSNFVDETRSADATMMSGKTRLTQEKKNDVSIDKEILTAFENFDMSLVKKAGPIFDGFCIWVSGLDGTCRERAAACVSKCGGVRYDAAHPRVTHAVAAAAAALAAARELPTVPVLSPLWLLKSVEAGRALDEAQFLIDTKPSTPAKSARKARIEPASPMSKRNLALLRRGPLDLPPPTPEVQEPQDELVNHYLSQHMPEPEKEKTPEPVPNVTVREHPDITEDAAEDPTEEIEQIFRGIKMEVQGLDEDAICEIGAEVSAAGGTLAAAGAGGSHVLVPLDMDVAELMNKDAEPVTVFWVKDCLSQQELVPIQYYHRPVAVPGSAPGPLCGVVASLSTYSGVERAFLDELAKLLGATTQLRFCRRNTANALASTHLICPTATGDKYLGALKWGLPAVQASWLLHCAKEGKRVSEKGHLVGDTKAPPSPQPQIEEEPEPMEVPEVQADEQTNITTDKDKENEMLPPAGTAIPRRGSVPSREQTPKSKDKDKENEMLPPAGTAIPRRGSVPSREQTPKSKDKDKENEMLPPAGTAIPRRGSVPSREQTPKSKDKDKENEMLPPAGTAIPRRGSVPSREQTPKSKDAEEMSPASRYIAMARQGLLGCDSQETPKRVADHKDGDKLDAECAIKTPQFEDALSTPNLAALSPTTRRRLQAVRRGEMPSDPIRTPVDPFERRPSTPDSAFGAALRPGAGRMSPDARKRLWQFVDGLPSKQPEPVVKDKHTPLSEIRNRFLAQFNGDAPTPPSEHNVAPRKLQLQDQCETPPAKIAKTAPDQSAGGMTPCADDSRGVSSPRIPAAVDAQLQRLSAALTGRLSSQRARRTRDSVPAVPEPPPDSEPAPESQPNTVGWDDTTPAQQPATTEQETLVQIKRFMLSSNVDNRDDIISMIAYLGGEVCEGAELDPEATHLLCAAPGRSEKMLGSIAAGRWVLHPVYVVKSRAAGTFLPEEEYEWGNPLATCLPPLSGAERSLARAAHRWRSARECGAPGPFANVVALLHVPPPRRRLLARLVTAGGGGAPGDEPPYTNDSITVCFADIKRYPLSDRDSAWLISKAIPVCAPVLLSSYLTDDPPPKPEEHCLPDFRP
uniref:BRCT domain-containing protein n=1 Tax=Heliothis virescens TaxID=7102 RepID=A0A2A4K3I6_HELVI